MSDWQETVGVACHGGKFSREAAITFDEDDDMLDSWGVRELVTKNGVGESAAAVCGDDSGGE